LSELIDILNKKKELEPVKIFDFKNLKEKEIESKFDFKYIL
jgi:hypothetical protein